MPLLVETGSGTNLLANGYVSVAAADSYHVDRSRAEWTGTTAAKEAAIVRATDYLDHAYEWRGEKIIEDQPLQWPRMWWGATSHRRSFSANTLPKEVVKACSELALLALTGELMPSQTGQRLQSESVGVGGAITRARSFAGGGGFSTERRFPFIDRMLAHLATGGSSGIRGARIERA